MKKITIIGASGHGKVAADIASLNGYDEIEFLDDNETLKFCGKYPIVGKSNCVLFIKNSDVFVAIGNCSVRKKLMEQINYKSLVTLVHPSAVIADDVQIGKGTIVMAGTVINTGTRIGNGVIINTSSSIDHDCVVDDFVHVAVGSHLCGTVKVGMDTWVGAGAIIINNVEVCSECFIGAGAVVTKNLENPGLYIGVPAKFVKHKNLTNM